MQSRTVILSIVSLLIASLISISVLSGMHIDVTNILTFIAASIVPTIASLLAYKEASHARVNTNGLLHATNEQNTMLKQKLDVMDPEPKAQTDATVQHDSPVIN